MKIFKNLISVYRYISISTQIVIERREVIELTLFNKNVANKLF